MQIPYTVFYANVLQGLYIQIPYIVFHANVLHLGLTNYGPHRARGTVQ